MDGQELLRAVSDLLDDRLGNRFEGIDARFDAMEKRMDGIDARLDGIDARLDGIDVRLDRMEKRQDEMELRLEKVESDTSALRHGQIEMHKELKNLSARVESTYMLALDAWGKSTENRNLLEAMH